MIMSNSNQYVYLYINATTKQALTWLTQKKHKLEQHHQNISIAITEVHDDLQNHQVTLQDQSTALEQLDVNREAQSSGRRTRSRRAEVTQEEIDAATNEVERLKAKCETLQGDAAMHALRLIKPAGDLQLVSRMETQLESAIEHMERVATAHRAVRNIRWTTENEASAVTAPNAVARFHRILDTFMPALDALRDMRGLADVKVVDLVSEANRLRTLMDGPGVGAAANARAGADEGDTEEEGDTEDEDRG